MSRKLVVGLKRIRVFVSDLPRILQEIVSNAIRSSDDMEVVGLKGHGINMSDAIGRSEADVVILSGGEDELLDTGRELLRERPSLEIMAIEPDGRQSFLYRLRPQMVRLGEISPQSLVEAIRDAVKEGSLE